MDKVKQWVALTLVGVIAVLAGGWFLLVSPKRADASQVRAQTAGQLSANNTLRSQIQMLKAQAKDLPKQQAKLAAVAAKIPDNPALPTLIRALTRAADEADVELVSLSPSQPTAVAGAAAPSRPVSAAGATPAAAGSTAAASAAVGTLQSITVSLNVVGGYFQVEQFLDRVENLSRAMRVSSLSMAPGSNPLKSTGAAAGDPGKVLAATISGLVYMASGRTSVDAPAISGAAAAAPVAGK